MFAEVSPIWADEVGRNSIAAFESSGYGYIVTSSYDQSSVLCLAIFDLNVVEKYKTKLVDYAFYFHSDFLRMSKVRLEYDFNLRDLFVFSANQIYTSNEKLDDTMYFMVVTWYNNGLLFFKATNLIEPKAERQDKFNWGLEDYMNPFKQFYHISSTNDTLFFWNNESQGKSYSD